MENLTTKIIYLILHFKLTRQTVCVAQENRYQGEFYFNFNFCSLPNPDFLMSAFLKTGNAYIILNA